MEPTQLTTISQAISSLGFDPVQVGEWAAVLVAWRLFIKTFSGPLQKWMETTIDKAVATGDPRIIGWVKGFVESLPYKTAAWILDATISFKLPLKLKAKEGGP